MHQKLQRYKDEKRKLKEKQDEEERKARESEKSKKHEKKEEENREKEARKAQRLTMRFREEHQSGRIILRHRACLQGKQGKEMSNAA